MKNNCSTRKVVEINCSMNMVLILNYIKSKVEKTNCSKRMLVEANCSKKKDN